MGFSINSALFNASAAYNEAGNAAAAQPAAQVQPQTKQQDTTQTPAPYVVQLTEAQQVYQLSDQGKTVPQIAVSLSLSEQAVNSYLGVSTTSA